MLTFGGKVITSNSKWIDKPIPLNTIRLRYKAGVTPVFNKGTGVCIDSSMNVWDLTYNNTSWYAILSAEQDLNPGNVNDQLIEVLGCNAPSVTDLHRAFNRCSSLKSVKNMRFQNLTQTIWMFAWCSSLKYVETFDTSKVTNMTGMFSDCGLVNAPMLDTSSCTDMSYMFSEISSYANPTLETLPLYNTSNVTNFNAMCQDCKKLKSIPLFDTSKATDVDYMFNECRSVESGALALYNQMANQTNPPTDHLTTFKNCGIDTVTGAAELEQIPSDWK